MKTLPPVIFSACLAFIFLMACLSMGLEGQVRGTEPGGYLIEKSLWRDFLNEYSAERTAKHIKVLSQFHRISGGSPGYLKAARYVADTMRSLEVYEVASHKHLADGDKTHLLWRSMPGWEIREAELWLENTGELITRFSDVPVSVFIYSNGADVSGEAVFVGKGDADRDYKGIDVKGKIVLATGEGNSVHREAVMERGALGVVTGPPGTDPDRLRYPNLILLQRLRSNKSLRKKTTFGFSLSRLQFQKIHRLIDEGKEVRLHAKVDARQYDTETETVSALLRGSEFPQKEIIFSAHLDHYSPGANDNCSGSASLLEMARTLKALMDQNIIKRPKRSIRFLWVGEMHGFAGYLEKEKDLGQRGIAGINLDMVGEDLYKTRSVLTLIRTPFSNPSFIGDVIEHLIKYVDSIRVTSASGSSQQLNYRVLNFKGGSDHFMLTDPSIGVPAVNIGHDCDFFHHTHLDDLEKVDTTELKRVGVIALAACLFLADSGKNEAFRLAAEVAAQGKKRMAELTKRNTEDLYSASWREDAKFCLARHLEEAKIYTDKQAEAEAGAVRSVKELSSSPEVKKLIGSLIASLKSYSTLQKQNLQQFYDLLCKIKSIQPLPFKLTSDEEDMQKIVPRRLFRGPISQYYFEDLMGEEFLWYQEYSQIDPDWVNRRTEIINLIDGKQNLLDIYYTVSAQYGRSPLFFYKKFINDMRKFALIEY
jgi:hypothetical protein